MGADLFERSACVCEQRAKKKKRRAMSTMTAAASSSGEYEGEEEEEEERRKERHGEKNHTLPPHSEFLFNLNAHNTTTHI